MPKTEVRGMNYQNVNDFDKLRKNDSKIKFKQCKECKSNSFCEGVWIEYGLKIGSSEFLPIK